MNILNTSRSSDLYFVKMLIHFLLPFLLILTMMLNVHKLRQQRSIKDKLKLRTRFSLQTDWIRKLLSQRTNGFVFICLSCLANQGKHMFLEIKPTHCVQMCGDNGLTWIVESLRLVHKMQVRMKNRNKYNYAYEMWSTEHVTIKRRLLVSISPSRQTFTISVRFGWKRYRTAFHSFPLGDI